MATDGLMGKAARLGSAVDGHLLCEGSCSCLCNVLHVLLPFASLVVARLNGAEITACEQVLVFKIPRFVAKGTTNVSVILRQNKALPFRASCCS